MNYTQQTRLKLALVGYGAIGYSACHILEADPRIAIDQIVVRNAEKWGGKGPAQAPRFVEQVDYERRPDVLVECAGHSAVAQHVVPTLSAGIPCIVVSVGALSAPGLVEQLEQAARKGGTSVQLLSGAIGGIDALAAARIGGLTSVRYEGRKPPLAWKGTEAEAAQDLASITAPVCIFEGSAREAARRFPKNANVAATVALAGLGLDKTLVALFADPGTSENQHRIVANGAFGSLDLTLCGKPLEANPKTSALTVFSVVRALANRAHPLAI